METGNNALQVPETHQVTAWTPSDVSNQVNAIQDLMRAAMKKDEHYGVIPGCVKPSLLKPGAEKLCLMFRLGAKYHIEKTDLGNGHREITVTCALYHINTGAFWGEGVGSCSTMETKYRYRGNEAISTGVPVPKAYWDTKKTDFKKAQELLGGPAYMAKKLDEGWMICEKGQKQENTDIADTYNTVLKMAKKRALVDATLNATAASDIFTQDVDENAPPVKPAPVEVKPEPTGETFGKKASDSLFTSKFALPEKRTKDGRDYWVTLDSEGAKLYINEQVVADVIAQNADKTLTVEIEKSAKGSTKIIGVI